MPKKAISVNISVLRDTIIELELDGAFPNRMALYVAVANAYNRNYKLIKNKLTQSIVRDRIKKNNIVVKTPLGTRGGVWSEDRKNKQKTLMKEGRKNAKAKRIDFKKYPEKKQYLEDLRQITPVNHRGLIESIRKGSIADAIKLNCLRCLGYDRNLVRDCTDNGCALWVFRPYQMEV